MNPNETLRRALVTILLAANACGGGGGGGQSVAPRLVDLSFPSGAGTTDAESITIRGTVALAPPIRAVRVNGIAAASSDGFATFAAEIPLSTGTHDVVVAVERPNLPTEQFSFAGRVSRVDPIVVDPSDVAFDAANGRLVLADRAGHSVLAIDPATGQRTLLSDPEHGSGAVLGAPRSLDVDERGKVAFVLDAAVDAIVRVDLANGDRTPVSGGGAGSGVDFVAPSGIAFDPNDQRVLVADAGLSAVVSVSVATGKRSILSDATHGSGAALLSAIDVALDLDRNRVLVTDPFNRALFAVNLVTGNRTIVSDFTHGSGDFFEGPAQMALASFFGAVLVTDDSTQRVFMVDLSSGNRSILVDDEDGGGTEIGRPGALAADPNDGTTFIVDDAEEKLVRLEVVGGARDVLFELPSIGRGPSLEPAERVALDRATRRVFVVTEDPPAIVAVDLATGARTTFSDATHGGGTPFVRPRAIALDAARRRLLVVDDSDDSLWSVSLKNGARTLLSREPVVPGDDLHRTFEIVLDDARGRALLIQSDDLILAVDLQNGARSEFSFDDPTVFHATRMDGGVLDPANGQLLVHDQALGLFAASLTDGTRTFVSAQVGGSGQDGGSGLAIDAARDRILITPRSPLPSGVGAVAPASGDLTMVSTADLLGFGRGPTLHKAVTLAFDDADGSAIVFDEDTAALFEVDLASGDRTILSR